VKLDPDFFEQIRHKKAKKFTLVFYFHLATNQFFAYIISSTQGAVLLNIKLTITASKSAPRVSSPPFPGGCFYLRADLDVIPVTGCIKGLRI
jgi:hypothetical protein